jgi:hypothetical protein
MRLFTCAAVLLVLSVCLDTKVDGFTSNSGLKHLRQARTQGRAQSSVFSAAMRDGSPQGSQERRQEVVAAGGGGKEYVSPSSSSSLALGDLANIASELTSRANVPHHLISGNDLFCNVDLNMGHMEAVGFDMDWTLAQYTKEFDLLAYNGAKQKLVRDMGYPEEVG